MANTQTFVDRAGSVIFDFDQKKIIYDRGGSLADAIGFCSLEVDMNEITDIEIRRPSFSKLGAFNVIINGIRYTTKTGTDITAFNLTKKAQFPALEAALKQVLHICGANSFKEYGSVNAHKELYQVEEAGLIYSFTNNTNSTLKVFENYLTIKHSGVLNTLSKSGLKGEKRIHYSSILAIECKKATTISAGYLQFSIAGADRAGGLNSAAGDENSILFDAGKNNLVQQIVDYIEKRRQELSTPTTAQIIQASSPADELKKFKELLDMGIITQEEFDAKKKQLLGL